ncbi:MAG TPA: DUF262 domain-containing protein [Sulfurovum sp.]|nr:MAG: HNH endonuclease [Sulfurovum sp. 35-42-20]OYZ25809.1 MAG: HNH endonuclease [Sulfurovum sp. 16-42-52]OYZ49421.1 MAG: HNH endonuclease [Sulfurovum sp. 24-42-9]OZA45189.1 MAG: HNH endonuclease [Sulfurovum sp. 17-42-90]OZA59848.1 MAG: HNH endonuclease [Sulfurovum sp. 39-42-12]HQR73990.1 DUF262 domain-containing protein [Sulfurovum sp.]
MQIELKEITIRELTNGYIDNEEDGVVGFDGKLDIRPPYQREFVYKDKQREAVIDTVTKGFPLNVMYWAMKEDGGYEVIDGQQRTISISQYINGDFAYMMRYFHNLQKDEQEEILDYKLMVYFCSGTDSEKLEWFKTINIAGEELTEQELRNAVYSGSWVTEAKKYFSRNGCVAYSMGHQYMGGTVNRQDYLETAIDWIAKRDKTIIEKYMATHQHDTNANELWLYFKSVIDWVSAVFPKYRKEMKGIEWGILFNAYKDDNSLDPKTLEAKISELMQDEDVGSKKGIYEYLLTGKEKHLNIRAFSDKQKREAYERQKGICPVCVKNKSEKIHYELNEMEADHITPWHEGGKTEANNCQMLCRECNRRKSGK